MPKDFRPLVSHTIVTYRLPAHERTADSVGRPSAWIGPQNPYGECIVSIPASSLTLANADYSWRKSAICRDTDPDLFFPVGTTGYALVQIDKAKQVCGDCPVSPDCLQYALETNQDSGIWGGTSEEERRQIRRRAAARHAAAV